ncbi:MAG: protein kinase [Myxococcales bacterium]|nr:protein kinase [Myxococcales bacterium]
MAVGDSADDTLPASGVTVAPARSDLPVVPRACYEVLSEHARGGLGRILRARDLRTGRLVAIKEMLDGTPDAATRFEREALVTANLQHPAIVPVYEVGRWPEGEPFYAMKLVDGRSLDAEIQDAATLRERLALVPRLIDVAEAIAYAHGQGVIHRDLKPANVLVGSYGETVVIDWGLARRSGDPEAALASSLVGVISGAVTLVGDVVGTPVYMPPEQARGEEVDARADVYALGAMLYYLLGGRVPYAGARTAAEVLTQIVLGPPQPLAELEPDTPPELLAIVAKAMAPRADDRYASARECAADLRRYQTGQLVGAHAYSPWQLLRRWLRRHRAVVSMSAVLVVALAATGAVAVRGIARERNVARVERARADVARAVAEQRTNYLIVEQARGFVARDPTQALAWLKQLPTAARQWDQVRAIAGEAREQGVARWVLRGHDGNVNDVEFTPDGRGLWTAGQDGTIRRWDLATGEAVVLHDREPVETVLPTPDGRWLVALGFWDTDTALGRTMRIWDVHAGTVRDIPTHPGKNDDVVLSPDGRSLAVMTCSGGLHVIDLATLSERALRGTTPRRKGQTLCPNSMGFSHDGALLAAESSAHTVDVFSVADGRVVGVLGDPADGVAGDVRFTVDDQRVLVLTATDLASWRTTGGDRQRIVPNRGEVRGFETTDAPGELILANADGSIRVWSTSQDAYQVIGRHDGGVNALTMTPERRRVLSGGEDGLVRVADVGGTWARVLRGQTGPVSEVAVARDGAWLASSSDDGSVRVWSTEGPRRYAHSAGEVIDGLVRAADGDGVIIATRAGCVERWTATAARQELRPCGDHFAYPTPLARSADGAVLVAGRVDGGLDVWRAGAATPRALPTPAEPAGLAMSADGAVLASVEEGGTVRRHAIDSDAEQVLARPELARRKWRALGCSRDGARIVWAEPRGLGVFDVATGGVRRFVAGDGEVIALVVLPAGDAVVSLDTAGGLRRWDLASGAATSLGAYPGATRLSLSGDGHRLVFADGANAIHVVDLDAPERAPLTLRGHTGIVTALAFSDDGLTLASASEDRTARLWDLATGAARAILHRGEVDELAFTPDSRRLITLTSDGSVSIIDDDLPRDQAGLRAYLAGATNLEVAPPSDAP